MLGVLYLLVCFVTGYVVCSFAFPELSDTTSITFRNHPVRIPKFFILFPAWFVSGTLLLTWTTYFLGYYFRSEQLPLYKANIISLSLFTTLSVIGIFVLYKKKISLRLGASIKLLTKSEIIFLILAAALVISLMWTTFHVSHNHLYVGISVYSDFSPHLGMIRSFSMGNNFPTMYAHFTGEDIRYHFMFEFLVGNLEFLGMRIDYAFNIPSIFSMLGTYMALYVLAVKLSGKRAVGYLSCLFFTFRSSMSFFTYLAEIQKGTSIIESLKNNLEFIGYTPNESWGLWNLNVYCNQRHFSFGLIILLIVIILMLPNLYDAEHRIVSYVDLKEKKSGILIKGLKRAGLFLKLSFFDADGWKVKNVRMTVSLGILLGSLAFFNGAVLIATLSILFVLAIFSDRRLEYLIVAVISLALSFAQSKFFITGSAVSPAIQFGFIADNKTVFGVLQYIFKLLGILPILLVVVFAISKKLRKFTILAFSAPFVLAFCLSLTRDIAVNHKYIMISVILVGIFVAMFLVTLFQNKGIGIKILCIVLCILMTATGIYDYSTVLRKNNDKYNLVFDLDSDITKWIDENTDSHDVFLTSMYSINTEVLGGAMMYLGWPYYAWSAGYDTDGRYEKAKEIFAERDGDRLLELLKQENIDYVIVDHDLRVTSEYDDIDENMFEDNLTAVYVAGSGEWKTTIYRVE